MGEGLEQEPGAGKGGQIKEVRGIELKVEDPRETLGDHWPLDAHWLWCPWAGGWGLLSSRETDVICDRCAGVGWTKDSIKDKGQVRSRETAGWLSLLPRQECVALSREAAGLASEVRAPLAGSRYAGLR